MVFPAFFSKSSTKKKSDSDSKSNSNTPDLSPRSSTRKSSRSPAKSLREREPRSGRKNSRTGNSSRQLFNSDTHPLNLPPDERERRRSAMESPGEVSSSMEAEPQSRGPSRPSSPPPRSPGFFQEINGGTNDDRNGDSSPIPPPHGIKTTSPPPLAWSQPPQQPPQQPSVDAEACKSLGNKYFIAKDYKKAIKEYTKGRA